MRHAVTLAALALSLLACPGLTEAQAQTPKTPAGPPPPSTPRTPPQTPPRVAPRPKGPAQPRFTLSIGGGYQPTTTSFDDSFTFTRDQETGRTRTSYDVDAGAVFDGGFGARLWRGLGVGVALSRFTVDGVISATSSIPHPFFLNRHRDVSGEAGGMRREETGVHVQAQYTAPIGKRLQVTLMGGATSFHVSQTVVIDVNYTEEYPYDAATFAGVDSTRKTGTAAGFNAGADVRWMFSTHVGAGGLVRVARGTAKIDAAESRTISVDVGGVQAGGGIRLVF